MKKLLLLLVLLCGLTTFAQNGKLSACCSTTAVTKTFGRCSGDASCTACTNCRYCKHCSKEGGSCGVCAPEPVPAPKPKATKKTTKKKKRN